MSEKQERDTDVAVRARQQLAAWIFGSFLLLLLAAVLLFMPPWNADHPIAQLLGAILAGFVGFFLTGRIRWQSKSSIGSLGKVVVSAGGGCALFLMVWFGWPALKENNRQAMELGRVDTQGGNLEAIQQDEVDTLPAQQVIRAGRIRSGGGDVTLRQERKDK